MFFLILFPESPENKPNIVFFYVFCGAFYMVIGNSDWNNFKDLYPNKIGLQKYRTEKIPFSYGQRNLGIGA
jgi:hypothetical protein